MKKPDMMHKMASKMPGKKVAVKKHKRGKPSKTAKKAPPDFMKGSGKHVWL